MLRYLAASFFVTVFLLSSATSATVVQFQTSMGAFEVNLYDEGAPETVQNFLRYVDEFAYDDSIIHRSDPGFVIQGGGFVVDGDFPGNAIPTKERVINEPVFSNVRGTISMAKIGGYPNSATSQWFFNLSDNNVGLDVSNGGYAVFGEVVGDGMDIVDAIAELEVCDKLNSQITAYSSLPLRDYTQQNCTEKVQPDRENLVMINTIVVIDAAQDTAADLEPIRNLTPQSDDGGGASDSIFMLLLLLAFGGFGLRRKHSRLKS